MVLRVLFLLSLVSLAASDTPPLELYTSSVSLEVLEDQICSKRCADVCADEACEKACKGQFCSEDAEGSVVYGAVGVLCVVGVVSVAFSVFFGKKEHPSRRNAAARRQEGGYLHL